MAFKCLLILINKLLLEFHNGHMFISNLTGFVFNTLSEIMKYNSITFYDKYFYDKS